MTSYELWLFLHITAAIVWIGGAITAQVFGVLAKRSGDPSQSAALGRSLGFVGMYVFLPSAIVVVLTGGLLVEDGNWDWGSRSSSSGSSAGHSSWRLRSAMSCARWARSERGWRPRGRAPSSPGASARSS